MADTYNSTQIRRITRQFGLNMLESTPIASFYRPNAVIQVQTDAGTYALKPFRRSPLLRSNTTKQMNTAAGYVKLLMNSGYRYMPKWLPAHSGALWILSRGKPFYATEWIQGRQLETTEDFEQLGLALAVLHTTPTERSRTKSSPTLEQIQVCKTQDRLFRKKMARASKSEWFNQWVSKHGRTCKSLTDRAWDDLASSSMVKLMKQERAHPALIHNDVTSPNVIISDDGRLFIIDWDRIQIGSTYLDTVKTITNTTQFNPYFIQSFLKGYEECRPLRRDERKLIAILYRLPREAWSAFQYQDHARSRELLRIISQTWSMRLRAMELLAGWSDQS
ncbi:aminoglycoside phosphotransferase family protein [Paenibacillus sp.]|jgi:Ser/Thr protein kinase RdoA (MazF antagonist)|uniref:aminoglycoside phosphotransferase family protein n=1 Tax=Paenibacillus sp. TaxID=58172 RepID=UPI00281E1F72|nr:aminoglycoside phosphotransferase family protein [Paenibacillus sp.]MDR0268018.1 aminoglycoside phosphotransferase family protein [Paenibacillus sp.]